MRKSMCHLSPEPGTQLDSAPARLQTPRVSRCGRQGSWAVNVKLIVANMMQARDSLGRHGKLTELKESRRARPRKGQDRVGPGSQCGPRVTVWASWAVTEGALLDAGC